MLRCLSQAESSSGERYRLWPADADAACDDARAAAVAADTALRAGGAQQPEAEVGRRPQQRAARLLLGDAQEQQVSVKQSYSVSMFVVHGMRMYCRCTYM